jgi:hypothetical protein
VIAIVLGASTQVRRQQLVHHVAEKEGLLGLAVLARANVRQKLFAQNILCQLNALFAHGARLGTALANVVQCIVLVLNGVGVLQTRSQRLDLCILRIQIIS